MKLVAGPFGSGPARSLELPMDTNLILAYISQHRRTVLFGMVYALNAIEGEDIFFTTKRSRKVVQNPQQFFNPFRVFTGL